jgi:hypothetical protein
MNTWRVPDELRAKIAAVPPSVGRRKVAAKFGVSENTVTNIRREFGVKMARQGGPLFWGALRITARNTAKSSWPIRGMKPRPLAWAMEGVVAS